MFCRRSKLTPVIYDLREVVPILLKELRPEWKIRLPSYDMDYVNIHPGIKEFQFGVTNDSYFSFDQSIHFLHSFNRNINDIIIIKQELIKIIESIELLISNQLYEIIYIKDRKEYRSDYTFDPHSTLWTRYNHYNEIHIKKIDTTKLKNEKTE